MIQGLSPTAAKVLDLLEQRMMEGHSDAANRTWATLEMGVPVKDFYRLRALILRSWNTVGQTQEAIAEQRAELRVKYLCVYQKAIEQNKLGDAVKALDSIAKLDGLEKATGELTINVKGGITNTARETVAVLVDKMRSLALKAPGQKKLIDVGSNGVNGHSLEVDDDEDGS